ncbi:hypothetical protein RB653_005053 [Dictyostelium firmibasis]|uniref:Signal recognition particle subunit SRP72 n=1 Tax=Dictyostelium firmibasis TaxID=79012 RepID=A0AAN7UKD7_9MYCE
MSKDTTVSIEQLFKELDEHIINSQFKKAIRVCNKILSINSNDLEAFQCKVICSMQLSNFTEAIECFKNPEQIQSMSFEYAYCLYSTAKYQESLAQLEKQSSKETKSLELEAQIHYKLENYQKTISIYENLLSKPGYSDSVEFITNLCAVYLDAGKFNECQELLNKNKGQQTKTHELAFNSACLAISKNDTKTAETQLKLAKKICTDSLKKDGFSEEEIKEEQTSIDVQLGYVQQVCGNLERSLEQYQNVLEQQIGDSATLVATNNSVSVRSILEFNESTTPKEYTQAMDSLKSLLTEAESTRLNSKQKKVINYNLCLLLVQLKKVSQCEELIKTLKSKYGSTSSSSSSSSSSSNNNQVDTSFIEDLDIIQVSLLIKEKKFKEAEKLLLKNNSNSNSIKSQLLLAQIYLLDNNNISKALNVLEQLDSTVSLRPGIVATKVALYEKSGDLEKAINSLDCLITILEKQKKSEKDEEIYANLLKASGNFKLKHHKYKEASDMFDRVLKVNPNDLIALPSYIVATSHFDPSLSQKYEGKLPNIKFESKIDIDLIEKYGLTFEKKLNLNDDSTTTTTTTTTIKKPTATTTSSTTEVVKIKKSKKKLPKVMKPNYVPDPDRWLPKWQRANAKAARSKKNKDIVKGPQGIASASQTASLFVQESKNTNNTNNNNTQAAKSEKPRNIHKKKSKK